MENVHHLLLERKEKNKMKYDRLSNTDKLLFGECIRKLMNQSFIVSLIDPDTYRFLNDYSETVNEYLEALGYTLMIDVELQVVGMKEINSDDTMKFTLKERLKKTHTAILACIWKLYIQKVNEFMDPDEMFFELGELTNLISTWSLAKKELTVTELDEAFRLFSRHNLIKLINTDLRNEKTKIQLLPSLCMCLETSEFKKVAEVFEKEYKIGGKEIEK